jgi:hypothetical protein
LTNGFNTIWNSYASKTIAIFERALANGFNIIWDSYVCKATTSRECIGTNACNAVGEGYAGNIGAIFESFVAYVRASGDNDGF